MPKKKTQEIKKMNLTDLLFSMFKIGCIGFGGGNALIPIMEKEFVTSKKQLSAAEFNKYVVMANLTPGALPIEMAGSLGYHIGGISGMLLAATGMALPGIFATVLIVSLLSQFSGVLLQQVEYISVGIGAFIIYLLIQYNKNMLDGFKLKSMKIKRLCIVCLIYFLTCGKEIRNIFGISGTPIFDISTIHILAAAIFFIFYSFVNFTVPKGIIGCTLTILYLLHCGKSKLLNNHYVFMIVCILMAVLALYSIIDCVRRTGKIKKTPARHILRQEISWAVFLAVLSLPAVLTFSGAVHYILNGLLSSLVSFGGGEAYLSVAEGMFLDQGITNKQLYGQLLPVVNALPGSILCKMLSGIGYYSALNATGNIAVGYLTALTGLAVSITASCSIVFLVIFIYEKLEDLEMFVMLSKCIRPIVGGLLLSTASSLLYANISVGTGHGWSLLPSLLLFLFLLVCTLLMKKFTKLHNVVMILICGVLSLTAFHIF